MEIVNACRLFAEMCESALRWEEEVRFVKTDEVFEEVHKLYIGVAGGIISEAAKLPAFMAENFEGEIQSGEYRLTMTLNLPDGWVEAVSVALENASNAIACD